jgi:hypothetical protein
MLTATISGKLLRPDLGPGTLTATIEAVTDGTRLEYSGAVPGSLGPPSRWAST